MSMRDTLSCIREVDPPRPSRIATIAFPSRRIRDELDWITFKALEKDPARRYESAAAFANDIGRLLADEAVHAAPPSRRYRWQKFLRRNRAAATGSAFVFLALLAGVIGTTWQMLRAMHAETQEIQRATAATLAEQNATNAEDRAVKDRNRAVAAEADANAFNKFLVDHVLAASRPALTKQGLGRSVTLAEALTVAEAQIDRVFADRPTAEIKARIALGQTWFELRRFPDSEKHYLRAMELLARQTEPDNNLQLMCQSVMVQLMYNTSRLVEARKLAAAILPQFAEKFGPDSDETLTVKMELGLIYLMQDQSKPAMDLLREAMEGRLKRYGPTHAKTLTAMNNYAQALDDDDKNAESLAIHREVLKQRRATVGNDHPTTMSSMNNVGCQLLKTRQLKDAIEIFEEALPLAKTLLGDEHTTTNSIMNNLGAAYLGKRFSEW